MRSMKIYTRFIVVRRVHPCFASNPLFNGKPSKTIEFCTIDQMNVGVLDKTYNQQHDEHF